MTTPARRTNPWLALLVLCIANFVILLDTTIVNTAAPDIMADLGAGIDQILWVLNGYLLAFASLLILFGRMGDLVGPRKMFAAGLLLFTVASLLCGLAQGPGQLIAARVLQGVGAAVLMPQALVLISAIFPPERRGAALGIFTAIAGIASISGPTLGGFLITEYGWQSIFFLNVPICLVGIVLTFRLVPDLRLARQHSFDLVGVLLATAALFGIVYGLVEGERHDWGTIAGPITIPVILIGSLLLLVLFVLWERRQPEPLIPLHLFRYRNYAIATVITAIVAFSLFGFLLVFVIETQTLLGMSALKSGVTALPMTIALSALAPVAGRLADRIGGKILLIIGLAVYALGVVFVASVTSTSATSVTFVAPLIAVGIGMGLAFAPMTTEAMRPIPPALTGAASGVLNTARQVGSALGAAVIGAVLQNQLVHSLEVHAREQAAQLPPAARGPFVEGFQQAASHGLQLGSGQTGGVAVPANLPPDVASQFQRALRETFGAGFVDATRPTLGVVVGVLLLGSVLALFMVGRRKAAPAPAPSVPNADRSPDPETVPA